MIHFFFKLKFECFHFSSYTGTIFHFLEQCLTSCPNAIPWKRYALIIGERPKVQQRWWPFSATSLDNPSWDPCPKPKLPSQLWTKDLRPKSKSPHCSLLRGLDFTFVLKRWIHCLPFSYLPFSSWECGGDRKASRDQSNILCALSCQFKKRFERKCFGGI